MSWVWSGRHSRIPEFGRSPSRDRRVRHTWEDMNRLCRKHSRHRTTAQQWPRSWDANGLPPSSSFLPSRTGETHQAGDETSDEEMVSSWAGLRLCICKQSVSAVMREVLRDGWGGYDESQDSDPVYSVHRKIRWLRLSSQTPGALPTSKTSLGSRWLTD